MSILLLKTDSYQAINRSSFEDTKNRQFCLVFDITDFVKRVIVTGKYFLIYFMFAAMPANFE
jgi:hypothetical protein